MKSTKLFKFASLAAMVAATVLANSCKKQENTIDTPKGEVAGLVTDELVKGPAEAVPHFGITPMAHPYLLKASCQ